jgi:transposase
MEKPKAVPPQGESFSQLLTAITGEPSLLELARIYNVHPATPSSSGRRS